MIGFLAGFVGRASGPALVWILLGLMATNAATGWLLKNAWTKNAQAILVCENQALKDANARNLAVSNELQSVQADLVLTKEKNAIASASVEIENAARRVARENEHQDNLADLELSINEITDDDFWCASESVPLPVVSQLHNAASTYNYNRNREGAGIPPD